MMVVDFFYVMVAPIIGSFVVNFNNPLQIHASQRLQAQKVTRTKFLFRGKYPERSVEKTGVFVSGYGITTKGGCVG